MLIILKKIYLTVNDIMFLLQKLTRLDDYKRVKPIDLIETYAHGMSKGHICQKEKFKLVSIIKQYKK